MNDSPKPSLLKRLRRPPVIAAIVVVVGGLGWLGLHLLHQHAAAKDQYLFAPVEKGDIEDLVTATGTLQPRDSVDVGAQVSGQIQTLNVDVGDQVKTGQVLAEIDATQSEARVDADRASLASQQSQLLDRQNSLVKAQRDYERQQNLLKDDATTAQQAADAETTLKSAQQAIVSLKAQIQQAQANMRVEETQLKYTKIIAPIDGTVVSVVAKKGQTINATQQAPTILTIANLSVMTVQAQVSEADVSKLTKGMNAYFTTLSSNTRRYYGTVKRIEPTPKVQQSVVLYNVLFDVNNDGGQLLPSMTAQVFFVRAQAQNVLVVPMAALQQGQQIARELAAKNKTDQKQPAAGAAGAAPADAKPGAGATTPPTAAAGANPPGGAAPGAEGGQRPEGFGQGGNGQRQGGFGGFNGGQRPTPEQIEQMRQRFAQNGGAGGFRPGGGFGGFGGGGGGNQRQQRRNGTVMVKMPDGKLAARQVVVGVNDRVHGEVISGLKEGEQVVVGRQEQEKAAAPQNNQNQNNFRPDRNFGGGFPGGGFRPF